MHFTVKNAFRDPRTGETIHPKPGLIVELDGEHAERLQRANCLVPCQAPQPPAPVAPPPATPNGSEFAQPPAEPEAVAQPAPVKGKKGR